MSHELWEALCLAAAQYPTCVIRISQRGGWVRSFTVEHGPTEYKDAVTAPPTHVQPTLMTASARPKHLQKE
jgi:hypothetical protein